MISWLIDSIFGRRITASNCSSILQKQVNKIEKFKPISERSSISEVTKRQLWRKEAAGKMDTRCFCCSIKISMDGQKETSNMKSTNLKSTNLKSTDLKSKSKNRKTSVWHAGHIVSVAHGGSDDVTNLRILCTDCNLSMSSCHMYEYMIDNRSKGIKNLSFFDSWHWKNIVTDKNLALNKLDYLRLKQYINEILYRRLNSCLNSKKYPIEIRLPLINLLIEAGKIDS